MLKRMGEFFGIGFALTAHNGRNKDIVAVADGAGEIRCIASRNLVPCFRIRRAGASRELKQTAGDENGFDRHRVPDHRRGDVFIPDLFEQRHMRTRIHMETVQFNDVVKAGARGLELGLEYVKGTAELLLDAAGCVACKAGQIDQIIIDNGGGVFQLGCHFAGSIAIFQRIAAVDPLGPHRYLKQRAGRQSIDFDRGEGWIVGPGKILVFDLQEGQAVVKHVHMPSINFLDMRHV